jgi:glycosyltransferase involved in cell wall biosynthesis
VHRPLRVALDARILNRRGIGRYTRALYEGLRSISDIEVTAFYRDQHVPGDRGWKRLWAPGYVLQEQADFAHRFCRSGFDVVHLTANTAPVLQLAWPPTVVTVHDAMFLMSPSELALSPSVRQTLGRAYRFFSFWSGTRRVDHVVADSRHTARQLEERSHGQLPAMTVVYPAIRTVFFEALAAGATHALEGDRLAAGSYFLHPGAVDPRKNTRLVLEAFERYRATGGDAVLVVIGLAPAEQAWFARRLRHIRNFVRMLPFVSDDYMLVLLKAARAVVYVPSEEGFGYPLVEAMAAGVPVITSSIDVLDELSDGSSLSVPVGKREPLAEAMRSLDPEESGLRASLELRGRERARAFTVASTARATVEVYRETLERRRAIARPNRESI